MHTHDSPEGQPRRNWSTWAFIGFLAIAAFFLLSEHRTHLLGALPFLLLLACPLLHFFHHGGHAAPRDRDGSAGGHRH